MNVLNWDLSNHQMKVVLSSLSTQEREQRALSVHNPQCVVPSVWKITVRLESVERRAPKAMCMEILPLITASVQPAHQASPSPTCCCSRLGRAPWYWAQRTASGLPVTKENVSYHGITKEDLPEVAAAQWSNSVKQTEAVLLATLALILDMPAAESLWCLACIVVFLVAVSTVTALIKFISPHLHCVMFF